MQDPYEDRQISRGTTLLLACGAGLAVASIYYNQPMLASMGSDFPGSGRAMGLVPTLTQIGYALGILFLTLLGDLFDRRRVILGKGLLLVAALVATACARTVPALLSTSLLLGLLATMTQDIVPAAAVLSPPSRGGQAVGTVMTGVLLGILLSRVASGLAGHIFGWRVVYLAAAVSIATFLVVAWKALPRMPATAPMGYGKLLGSLANLWQQHPKLRLASFAQAAVSIGFGAFWSTLAVMLHERYGLGSDVAGAFGLAGAAGALGAPLAGRLADRKSPEHVVRIGAALVALAFFAMLLTNFLPGRLPLAGLVLGTVGFDLGYQFCLIPHQALVYSLEPAARSRLNALLYVGMFLGLSVGSALGSLVLSSFGWNGVLALGIASGLATLLMRL